METGFRNYISKFSLDFTNKHLPLLNEFLTGLVHNE